MRPSSFCVVIAMSLLLAAGAAHAFEKDGCASGACTDCHTLTKDEAAKVLAGMVDNVLSVDLSPVGGLWAVGIQKDGNKWPVYVDFSKKFLVNGQIIRLATKENVTEVQAIGMARVDVSGIPLDQAIVVGDPKAATRIIVFSDPDCHFCGMLHEETKKVVAKNPGIAFFVKLYSRANNPASARKALSVICAGPGAAKLMDDAYAGKALPDPACKTTVVEDTFRLAEKLSIRGTPTMVLPDGRVLRGYRDADSLVRIIGTGKPAAQAAPK